MFVCVGAVSEDFKTRNVLDCCNSCIILFMTYPVYFCFNLINTL